VPRRRWCSVVAGLTLAALTACGGAEGGVSVPVDAGAASLPAGETLRVELGNANPSVGDSWHLIGPPDPAVLVDTGQVPGDDCDSPGCQTTADWTFTAAAPGTTAVVFRYCYRSAPPACEPMPDRAPDIPLTLTVTVR
jgi:predicted secreted protein